MWLFGTRDNEIDDEHTSGPDDRATQISKNTDALVVAPIMKDRFQNICIGRRCLAEHVAPEVLTALG